MESKLDNNFRLIDQVLGLLIEPVWNRNIGIHCLKECLILLLIEPVWNRNRLQAIRLRRLRSVF